LEEIEAISAVRGERSMFEELYHFFFADQRRKRVVLIVAFFSGQFVAMQVFERVSIPIPSPITKS
jgi:hypothetical protein